MKLLDIVQYSDSKKPIPLRSTSPFEQSIVGAFRFAIVDENEVGKVEGIV